MTVIIISNYPTWRAVEYLAAWVAALATKRQPATAQAAASIANSARHFKLRRAYSLERRKQGECDFNGLEVTDDVGNFRLYRDEFYRLETGWQMRLLRLPETEE